MQIMNNIKWFIDMCIIIYYAKDNPNSELSMKAANFVKNKGNSQFLLCYYISEINLPKWIKRQRIIIEEVKRNVKDNNYSIGSSFEGKILFEQDKNECKKLYFKYMNTENKSEFFMLQKKNQQMIEQKISYFINKLIDKKVIPISEIDFELKSSLFTYLDNNDSDAKTIASAVQQHNKETQEQLIIITSDKKHWTKQLLEDSISLHPALTKKYPKLPEIKYLQEL